MAVCWACRSSWTSRRRRCSSYPGASTTISEVGGLDDPYTAYITTGPVPGFLVDDIVEAREELETAGIEIVEPVRWMADVAPALVEANPKFVGYGWFAFALPTATSTAASRGRPGSDRVPAGVGARLAAWTTTSSL